MRGDTSLVRAVNGYNEYVTPLVGGDALPVVGALLSREELVVLTGTKQARRMCAWLLARGWIHEPPARRGDIPKVLRAYRDARMSGVHPVQTKRADYSFMTAGHL